MIPAADVRPPERHRRSDDSRFRPASVQPRLPGQPPTWGNQTLLRLLRARAIQPKRKVSQPDDVYEREADRLSEQVVGRHPKREQARLPLDMPPMTAQANSAVPGTGKPLPAAQRAFFETRLGDDFGSVRIHTRPQSARLARALNARAFTMGNDIVFDRNQYAPQTSEELRLLAHELVHVRQQRHGLSETKALGNEMVQREPHDPPPTAGVADSPCPDLGDIPAIPHNKEMLKEQQDLPFNFPRLESKCFWTIRGGSDNCCGYCLFRASGGALSGKGTDVAIPPTTVECDALFAPFYEPIESAAVNATTPPTTPYWPYMPKENIPNMSPVAAISNTPASTCGKANSAMFSR